MKRRDFLKGAPLLGLAGVAAAATAVQPEVTKVNLPFVFEGENGAQLTIHENEFGVHIDREGGPEERHQLTFGKHRKTMFGSNSQTEDFHGGTLKSQSVIMVT